VLLAAFQLSPEPDDAPPPADRAPPELAVTSHESDSLSLGIQAPGRVSPGEPVPVVLRVENVSGRTLDLYLRGRTIAFDIVVTDTDGRVVWRRLEGEVIPAILRIETLEAGAALELEASWDQRSSAGEPAVAGLYRVHGELLTEADPLVTPAVPLRVEPGA
jgi:hypothetical protein